MWAPYSAFLSTQNGPFHVMSATPPPPHPLLPLKYREILKGREGVSKVIYEGVAMSVPLISQKHLPFLVGVHTLNGMAQWHPTAQDIV